MLEIINPATEKRIQAVEEDSEKSIQAKFNKAKDSWPDWWHTPLSRRKEIVRRFSELIAEDLERLALLLTQEMGKPIAQSRNELKALAGRIGFFLDPLAIDAVLSEERVYEDGAGKIECIRAEPLGVIGNISAWNYPYFVGSNVFIPALLCGNSVLYKPSELTTLTGLAIADLFRRAGLPEGLFLPVVGSGAAGRNLLAQDINGIFFTGSYPTGRSIAEAVGGRMIRTQLELGGKDPTYVAEDAPLENAVASLSDGAFYNTGQSCCSVERIYVHERSYAEFLDRFVGTVRGFVMGDPTQDKTYIGPLARKAQLDVLDHQVQQAISRGARLLCGGKRGKGPGYYYEPTVLSDTDHTMTLMKEESFGPIIGIQKVSGDEEAIRWMNDSAYGLTAGIYTPNRKRAEQVLSQINAGSVYWNCCDRVSPRLPWTGRKHSGIGSTLSTHGIRSFIQLKAWHLNPC